MSELSTAWLKMGIFPAARWVEVGDLKRMPWMNGYRGGKRLLRMKKDKKKGFKGSRIQGGK
jgi:hypothetical protein